MIPMFKVYMSPNAAPAVQKVLDSGYIGQGPRVDEFEEKLSKFLGMNDLLTVSSGTAALDLALHLTDAMPGDIVISTPQTCTATNGVIANRGLIIMWADVDPRSGRIDPRSVAQIIDGLGGDMVSAIMAVDWAGELCDYQALKSHGIPVIEDAAHAFGADRLGSRERGDYCCWSFQAIKHLTTGDGGLLSVPSKQVDRARLLRWYGLDRRSSSNFRCEQNIQEIGYKYHMNDIAASIGISNLEDMEVVIAKYVDNARYYNEMITQDGGKVAKPTWSITSSWWLYTLLVSDRASFSLFMKKMGIDVSEVHARNDKHKAFQDASEPRVPLDGLDSFSKHQVSIPVHWGLSEQDREIVAKAVNAWSRELS